MNSTFSSLAEFKQVKLIGEGANGKVYRAYHKKTGSSNYTVFAVKVFNARHVSLSSNSPSSLISPQSALFKNFHAAVSCQLRCSVGSILFRVTLSILA